MRLFAAVLLWLTAATAHAQITVPAQVDAHQPIVAVLAENIPDGAKLEYAWRVTGGDFLEVDGKTIHVWAAPGNHTITARGYWILTKRVTMPDGQEFDALLGFGQFDHSADFKVGGTVPPVPPPHPPGNRWPFIVEESSRRTTQQAALWQQVRLAFKSKYAIEDRDNPSSAYKAYFAAASAVQLPALVVVAADGSIVSAVPCPETLDGIRQQVAR